MSGELESKKAQSVAPMELSKIHADGRQKIFSALIKLNHYCFRDVKIYKIFFAPVNY